MKKILFLIILFGFTNLMLNATIKLDSVQKKNSICLNNGSITVFASSSSQVFYSIVAGPSLISPQSSNILSSLTKGTYKVKIENLLGEKDSINVLINSSYLIPDFNQIVKNISCRNNSDGMIIGNLISNGGIKPYQWKLKNNNSGNTIIQSNDTFKNQPKGDYTLTLTDSCLNTTVHNFEIKNTKTGIEIINSNINLASCSTSQIFTYYKTIENDTAVLIKYKYKNNFYTRIPNTLNYTSDTLNFKIKNGEFVEVTIFNACNDSFKYIEYYYEQVNICTEILGCDTTLFTVNKSSQVNFISTIIAQTKNGTTVTSGYTSGIIQLVIPNVGTKDSVNFKFITICNDTFENPYLIPELSYSESPYTEYVSKCEQKYKYRFYSNSCSKYKEAIKYKLKDIASNLIVDSGFVSNNQYINLKDQTPGLNYEITITDGCGDSFKYSFYWKLNIISGIPTFTVDKIHNFSCLDSTCTVAIITQGNVKSITGPMVTRNTKSKYNYTDQNQYDSIVISYLMYNLGVGIYTVTVEDSCGEFTDSFEIFGHDVSNNFYTYTPIPFCQDNNQLILNLNSIHTSTQTSYDFHSTSGWYSIYDYQNNIYINNDSTNLFNYDKNSNFKQDDTFKYLKEGKYLLKLHYRINDIDTNETYSPFKNGRITKLKQCTDIIDTLIIPPYSRPEIDVIVKIKCQNNSFVFLTPDTSFGVFPYKYEINKGPITYPEQQSNVFMVNPKGNYQAKIWDTCGNANTMDFTIDTIKFEPAYVKDTSCSSENALIVYQSSPYLKHKWTRPNGTSFIGDTLKIDQVQLSDIGTYQITRYVDFIGCKDSFNGTYILNKTKRNHIYDTIKDGDSILFNNKYEKFKGIYGQIIPKIPCDSLNILHLYVLDTLIYNKIKLTLCNGDSIKFNGKWYKTSGIYYDTLIRFNMPDIAYQITIIDNIKYFQFNTKILGCNFVNISGISYFKDTIHRDSFKSIYGCDSIIATPIQVTKSKIKHDTISACVYTKFKNRIYTFTVLYADSIVIKSKSNPNCDSLVTYYHVYIWPNPIAKITPSIPNPVLTNQTVILVASGGTKYLWIHDSSRNDSIKYIAEFKDSTTFIVYVYNENNCFDTAMYTILNYDKCSEYFIPNVFTPNGDDVNDYFMPMLGRCIHTKLFMIFDRWGEKMFETNSDHHGWDGRFKGEYMPPGLFIYHAEIITPDGIQTRNGNVLLVR